jgi:glycosyltransferase involved in cell wall biosynthesis
MLTLSIVTIVLNHAEGVRRTAMSVKRNRPDWVEWVVIDGQSEDGTVEVLKGFEDQIDRIVSEPDNGIADAFNKGVWNALGECVLFLNAGDELHSGFYEFLGSKYFERAEPMPAVLVGRVKLGDRLVGQPVGFAAQKLRNRLPHQAMVIRRDLFDSLGLFREDFSLGMDYEWSLRLKDIWSEIRFTDRVFAIMEPGGVSMSDFKGTYRAYHQARMKHGMARVPSAVSSGYFTLKVGVGNTFRTLVGRIRRK